MINTLRFEGENLFYKRLNRGVLPLLKFWNRKKARIPSLDRLLEIMPSQGETYVGRQEIPVDRIIGSEDRAQDFIGDFYPRKPWMQNRWVSVYVYMNSSDLIEPVEAIEYGGYYFVRDGNHRVSIAKAVNLEFLAANVQLYKTPFSLPPDFTVDQSCLLAEKVKMQRETGLFDHMDDTRFDVRRKGTWRALRDEIFIHNREWFIRKNGREPHGKGELIAGWDRNLYAITSDMIEEHSLHYLFPRWGTTDIFIDFVKYWNSFPKPDDFWLEEMYRRYSKHIQKRRFILTLVQISAKRINSFFDTPRVTLDRFTRATQIQKLIPRFTLPVYTKKLIRFIYRQIYFDYALFLKKKLKRAPYIQELTLHWHEHYYSPLIRHYNQSQCQMNFTQYYIKFSRRNFKAFMRDPGEMESFVTGYCRGCANAPLHGEDSIRKER